MNLTTCPNPIAMHSSAYWESIMAFKILLNVHNNQVFMGNMEHTGHIKIPETKPHTVPTQPKQTYHLRRDRRAVIVPSSKKRRAYCTDWLVFGRSKLNNLQLEKVLIPIALLVIHDSGREGGRQRIKLEMTKTRKLEWHYAVHMRRINGIYMGFVYFILCECGSRCGCKCGCKCGSKWV